MISWIFGSFQGTKTLGAVWYQWLISCTLNQYMISGFMISHMISYILAIISLYEIHIWYQWKQWYHKNMISYFYMKSYRDIICDLNYILAIISFHDIHIWHRWKQWYVCECPKDELDRTDFLYPLRNVATVKEQVKVAQARCWNRMAALSTTAKHACAMLRWQLELFLFDLANWN